MNSYKFFLICFVMNSCIIKFVVCEEVKSVTDGKIIVSGPENLVHPRPGIKPTEKPQIHQPGVPPSGPFPGNAPNPIVTTTTKPKPINNNPFNWISSLFQLNRDQKISNDVNGEELDNSEGDFNDTSVEFINDTNLTAIVESAQLILKPNTNTSSYGAFVENQEPNKGVVDWVLGLVGIQTSNGNGINNNKPSKPEETHSKICNKCTCGVTFKRTRIVGGVETEVNAYPWMAYLTYNGRFYCGASVINNKYLLTATHCVNGFSKDRLQAVFLDHDRSSETETKTFKRKIAAILKHRSYNQGGAYNNDISLLKLDQDLTFNGLLRPVCLPTTGKSFTGYTGIAIGWGATEEHGQVSNKLREVEVPILSNVDCRKTGYGTKISDNMLCAGYLKGQKDSCQGDSGGPLQIVNRTLHTIVGIVSWGEGCAEPNYPGVYTRVNRYITWIKANTRDACYCS